MILRTLTALLLSTAIYMVPVCSATSRHPGHQGRRPTTSLNSGRPGANIQPGRPNHGNGHGHGHGVHPGPSRPQQPHIGSHGHGHGHGHRPPHAAIPQRPHRPHMHQFHRPVPPPSWHPVGRYPVLSTILGISFGTAIGLSINALVADGYTVTGYGDNMVYLTNVPQLSMIWPDATLYYGANGGLMSSQFVYATPYRDLGRFDIAYNRLVNLYGSPADYSNASGSISATWFGRNGQFVSLTFAPQYTGNGVLNYCTALSFGN